MYSITELRAMEDHELVDAVLRLQAQLEDIRVDEFKSSAIYRYHFEGKRLLDCSTKTMLGSGVILTLHSLKGKPLIEPVEIVDGLSVASVNALLDDFQRTFDMRTKFLPPTKRLAE